MKSFKVAFVLLIVMISTAHADSCVSKADPEKAFQREVRIAVAGDGQISQIVKTVNDLRNPEYDVHFSSGNIEHVTCDDSGDNDCGCEAAK